MKTIRKIWVQSKFWNSRPRLVYHNTISNSIYVPTEKGYEGFNYDYFMEVNNIALPKHLL
jgi:hypothetical protein